MNNELVFGYLTGATTVAVSFGLLSIIIIDMLKLEPISTIICSMLIGLVYFWVIITEPEGIELNKTKWTDTK